MIKRNSAFTLLEMAIVVAVISLVIGGVISGQALIRQSNLRSVLAEYDQYTKAIKEFQDKFQALPGDFSTAQSIWGSAAACPMAYTASNQATAVATCNGDGDGKVGDCSGAMSCTAGASNITISEIWLVWHHLGNADLLSGKYSGARGASGVYYRALVGVNVPASARKPAGWTFLYYQNPTTGASYGDFYGHVFLLGGDKGAYDGKYTTAPVLFVSEAQQIDTKLDDGFPRTGIVRAWENYWLSTSESAVSAGADTSSCINTGDASYYASYPDKRANSCSLIFIPGL